MRALWTGLPGLLDLPGWFRAVFSRRRHPVLQFIRYGLAGVAAMATNVLVFALSDLLWFPVGEGDGVGLPASMAETGAWLSDMAQNSRVQNYLRCNVIAFLVANVVAYVLNFTWVFQSGRHSRRMEVFLFLLVSFIAFVAGTVLASFLVGSFGVNEYLAKIGDVVAAILLNYVCRKFLIFES